MKTTERLDIDIMYMMMELEDLFDDRYTQYVLRGYDSVILEAKELIDNIRKYRRFKTIEERNFEPTDYMIIHEN